MDWQAGVILIPTVRLATSPSHTRTTTDQEIKEHILSEEDKSLDDTVKAIEAKASRRCHTCSTNSCSGHRGPHLDILHAHLQWLSLELPCWEYSHTIWCLDEKIVLRLIL